MAVHITVSTTSAEVVDSINDLLLQILLRLPVKSLMRFKLVSKHWKSVITSPDFSLLRNPRPNPTVGFVYPGRKISEFEYINVDVKNPTKPPFRKLSFPEDPYAFWIQQSCNGLLLCCSSGSSDCRYNRSPIRKCYVYNPTTNCFTKLPRPGVLNQVPRIVHGVNLAFDHAKSPPYKAVCVRGSEFARELLQIEIYSAESGVWRVSGEPFTATASFDYGVYWNGSIHWLSYEPKELLYFNVDKERFAKMPLPVDINGVAYFGESCDHLHIIGNHDMKIAFNVYEMKRDYSEWFVKYRVDLTAVLTTYRKMAYHNNLINRLGYAFSVLSLIRDVEEGSFLVLRISHKVVLVNLSCNTLEEIHDCGSSVVQWSSLFEYIESLACV
ncbi:hypothetical protein BUALT_Bualt11G0054400 [Buddleja alternifolia]|uniref:F-box domain-containing protein n=1 Tax=Buddleja alternifolia TaxID=168488 RepID=A0AAV6WTI6_9LAMI|nr:hypothetical protein BUALT_Bualt11G0054400 [Buddleja alternifolia]